MNSGKVRSVIVHDLWTNKVQRFDSGKDCAKAMGMRPENVNTVIKNGNVYKNRYYISYGEEHDKKVRLNYYVKNDLLDTLLLIVKQVPNSNMVSLTNAVCSDFFVMLERMERNKQEGIYNKDMI